MTVAEAARTPHSSDETLSAFMDGRLGGAARREVIHHLATCDECRSVFQTVTDLQKAGEIEAPNVVHGGFRWYVAIAAAAAAAVVIAFFYAPLRDWWDMRTVVKACEKMEFRPSQARLIADSSYRKTKTLRGDKQEDPKSVDVQIAAAEIAEKAPSPARDHSLGIAYLQLKKGNEARTQLESALIAETGAPDVGQGIDRCTNAALLNDLAVVYQTWGPATLAPKAAQRAWSLKHTPQIAWTRALVLESNPKQAIQAWRDYLAIDKDKDPRWREEAQQRLENLEHPLQ